MNSKKENIGLIIFILTISAIFYFINIYYIGLSIVYLTLFITAFITISMITSNVKSGVVFGPMIILLIIGFVIMKFGNEEDPILNSTIKEKNKLNISIVPNGESYYKK